MEGFAGGYQIPGSRAVKPWLLSLGTSGEGSFRDGSGFTTANSSAALFSPPLSYIDAPLTPIDVTSVREAWDRTFKPGAITIEEITGP